MTLLFSKGNSQGKMQKDGTLGVNRAREDYLLQPFQNGKLHMINIPLPRDGGKGHFRITLAQTDLSFSWLGMRIALEVNWFSHVKLWGCFLNGKDKTHCIFAPKEFEGYCLFITEIIIGRLTIGLLEISLIQAQNIVHNCYLATFGNKNFFMLQHSQHIY